MALVAGATLAGKYIVPAVASEHEMPARGRGQAQETHFIIATAQSPQPPSTSTAPPPRRSRPSL